MYPWKRKTYSQEATALGRVKKTKVQQFEKKREFFADDSVEANMLCLAQIPACYFLLENSLF